MAATEIQMERTSGDRTMRVNSLSCTEVPGPEVPTAYVESHEYSMKGHTIAGAENFLSTWTMPEKIREIQERVERALEEGIPDRKRKMLRNEEDGMLDDRFVDEIALGLDVENPFMRWNKSASDTCRVAVCFDANVIWSMAKEVFTSKMIIAAGVGGALESLDYEVQIIGARFGSNDVYYNARESACANPTLDVTMIKDEDEPLAMSNFASVSDVGIARLLRAWRAGNNGASTGLTNREWRELTDADLFIHIKERTAGLNGTGLPLDSKVGLHGDDVLSMTVSTMGDIDAAIDNIENFFQNLHGE